jgi:hypothetical protein
MELITEFPDTFLLSISFLGPNIATANFFLSVRNQFSADFKKTCKIAAFLVEIFNILIRHRIKNESELNGRNHCPNLIWTLFIKECHLDLVLSFVNNLHKICRNL